MKVNENFDFRIGEHYLRMTRRRNMKKGYGKFQIMAVMLLFTALLAVGCASGGGGVLGTAPKLDQNLADAWQYVRVGDNNNAIIAFRQVMERTPNKSEEISAHTGLAWAYAQLNDTDKAASYFEKVKTTSNDANLGYAGVLLSRGKENDYKTAVSLLEAIHINNVDQAYLSEYKLDITTAQAHALMGIAYYYTGDYKKAKLHIEKAKSADVSEGNSPIAKIANALLTELKLEEY